MIDDHLSITDVDLCSIIGNLLENAISACQTVFDGTRFIQLSVAPRNNRFLYIVATNNFDGNIKLQDGIYCSTHRKGNGIGLTSIRSIAEHYGGTANFSHEGSEFYTNVVLPFEQMKKD